MLAKSTLVKSLTVLQAVKAAKKANKKNRGTTLKSFFISTSQTLSKSV